MAFRNLRIYPDPVLRKIAEPISEFNSSLKALADEMLETMYLSNGIGLAAPQIGELQRIIVLDVSEDRSAPLQLINPEIVRSEGSVKSEEGCLSIPDFRDTIDRFENILVKAFNPMGDSIEIEANELLAICLQHEIDHLNGVLFIDHLSRIKHEMFERWVKKNELS